MILLIGQIARDHTEREAFQEIDYRRMFGEMAKWVGQIDDEARVAEYLSHAFYRAQAGRPGPVVLALPEDMLTARAAPATITAAVEIQAHPGADDMQALNELLGKAKRPLAILGGGGPLGGGFGADFAAGFGFGAASATGNDSLWPL